MNIKNILTLIVSIILSLIILEFGLRFFEPDSHDIPPVLDHSNREIPKQKTTVGPFGNIATFDHGFRKNIFNCDAPNPTKILVVGDSNISALFLSDDDHIGSLLAQKLNNHGVCVHVDTYGVPGLGPDQNLFAINSMLQNAAYEYVIFHIFADNDAGDLIRNNNEIKNQILMNSGYCYPVKGFVDKLSILRIARKLILKHTGFFISGWSLRNSMGNDSICDLIPNPSTGNDYEDLIMRSNLDWNAYSNGKMQIYMGDRYDIEFACKIDPAQEAVFNERFSLVVKQLAQLANLRSFKPVFLIQPSKYDMLKMEPIAIAMRENCKSKYAPNNLVNLYRMIIGNKFLIVDLYDAFIQCKGCYFNNDELPGDNHWNRHGAEIAADRISKIIYHDMKR